MYWKQLHGLRNITKDVLKKLFKEFRPKVEFSVPLHVSWDVVLNEMRQDSRLIYDASFCSVQNFRLPEQNLVWTTQNIWDGAVPYFLAQMLSYTTRNLMYSSKNINVLPKLPVYLSPSSIPFHIQNDLSKILTLLPEDLATPLTKPTIASGLLDIVLDRGRRPWAWVNGSLFGNDRVVTQEDLDGIIKKVDGFVTDNRAGLERQLHRISAIHNRAGDVIGLFVWIDTPKAMLLNVCFVDTSIPHPSVDLSSAMKIPSLNQQTQVVECVFHSQTPEIMVIDDIARPNEVEGARTYQQRGVRMITSARGDLRDALKDKTLLDLVCGEDNAAKLSNVTIKMRH
ncbi:hypothetical protein THRCLA_22765 [Thraustotheca clavata]|uniref:Uncharacterized protein n=1 Tax=Thraustotheca clavata TaxID=74557 RepID=A0A1V9YTE0_9STRA|nr:hypothetical protein THRCLA_22765 [Thraustotheca clavata]